MQAVTALDVGRRRGGDLYGHWPEISAAFTEEPPTEDVGGRRGEDQYGLWLGISVVSTGLALLTVHDTWGICMCYVYLSPSIPETLGNIVIILYVE